MNRRRKIKVEITMEKTQRVAQEYDVTDEQLDDLKNGINPFKEEMEDEIESGDCDYDFAVADEDGNTIVDWS